MEEQAKESKALQAADDEGPLVLCSECVSVIGGACGGPDCEWRPTEDGEDCGAYDCEGRPNDWKEERR